MATFTPNYGLHQWEPEDSFLRTDFNQDHVRIEAALDGKAVLLRGSFTGNGSTQEIILGFRPTMVCFSMSPYLASATVDQNSSDLRVTEQGFWVSNSSPGTLALNGNGTVYHYLILREGPGQSAP